MRFPFSFARDNAGKSIAARIAMIAITTSIHQRESGRSARSQNCQSKTDWVC